MTDLIDIFRAEADANLREATRLALGYEQGPPGRGDLEAMMRVFHTLKGAARAVNLDQERDIAHRVEDLLHRILDGTDHYRPALVDLCLQAIDLVRGTLDARAVGGPLPDPADLLRRADDYQAGRDRDVGANPPMVPIAVEALAPAATDAPDLDLLAIFRTEVDDQLAQARARLAVPDGVLPDDPTPWGEHLRRVFHTLKGAARAIACDPVRELAGALEDLMRATPGANQPAAAPPPGLFDVLACGLAWIEATLDALARNAEPPAPGGLLEPLARYQASGIFGDAPLPTATTPPFPPPALTAAPEPSPALEPPAAEALPGPRRQARIDYEQLDRLHRLSGELTVAVAALASQRHQLRVLSRTQARAGAQLERLVAGALSEDLDRDALPEVLRTGSARLSAGASALDALTEAHDRMEGRLHHIADALADQITQARLVPLSDLLDDYPRLARDLALELGKRVELRVDGADNRIDRAVLEQLRNPLLHLLRNALDHGLEAPAQRTPDGKPAVGRVLVEARQLGSRMRIRVEDDGAGIDMQRLAGAVIAAGHTTPALWAQMDIGERLSFLFLPGFSTAHRVSATSGRGFGLDIVKAGIEAAGGSVSVQSEPGRGTRFELLVPLTLSLTRCLLVVGGRHPLFGDQRYAFPMGEVARVRRLASAELREIGGRMAVHLEGETLPLVQLHALLGLAPVQGDLTHKHLLVLGDGETRAALLVEAVVDEQDMVAHPLDERLGKVAEVAGLTLLEDGGLALILDVPDLLQHIRDGAGGLDGALARAAGTPGERPPTATGNEAAPEQAPAAVLVVEDSVTVREVERHFLEQAGYQVTTAVNGVDGLNKAKAGDFQIMITDIDMPRMNGIELIRTLRGIDRFHRLPIIVVSYKDRSEDRERALEAGADHYVTKSEFDTDAMLALVARLLASGP